MIKGSNTNITMIQNSYICQVIYILLFSCRKFIGVVTVVMKEVVVVVVVVFVIVVVVV